MFQAHPEEGLRKLMYSDQVAGAVEAHMQLVTDPADKLVKSAADAIFKLAIDDLKPPKGHVGIHTVALGDFETYGFNRNGDSFPKEACARYHDTFVKNGHVFVGHKNHDPIYKVGDIVASGYNEKMGRIELYSHVDEKKAAAELHRLAEDGDHAFSMACKVPFDRCNKCNTLRKSAADPAQCNHVRDHLGEVWKCGTAIGVHNDRPNWFDESFVGRPADRISWQLKVASHGIMDSVKLAETEGIWIPDNLETHVPGYSRKRELVQKLAALETEYTKIAAAGRRSSGWERYLWELGKAASWGADAATVDGLRAASPDAAFATLARRGVIMPADTFFKYAMGDQYGELAEDMPRILEHTRAGLFSRLQKSGAYQRVCRNSYFDVDTPRLERYSLYHTDGVNSEVVEKIATAGAFVGPSVDQRIIESTVCGRQVTFDVITLSKSAAEESEAVQRGVEVYAAYKLSALDAALIYHKEASNEERLLALAAVQNLME